MTAQFIDENRCWEFQNFSDGKWETTEIWKIPSNSMTFETENEELEFRWKKFKQQYEFQIAPALRACLNKWCMRITPMSTLTTALWKIENIAKETC